MLLVFEEGKNRLVQSMKLIGMDQKYSVKKTIMETSLYTIYLISAKKQTLANDEVLLLEHLPAKEPAAHLLPIKIKESATTTETMQKIVEAVHAHFAQNE